MATELRVRIRRNPYVGSEAVFWFNGMLHRYSFELQSELAFKLVDDCIPQHVIDEVMDCFDATEWGETYPLGVVYAGEAVCDSPVDEPVQLDCDCEYCRHGHNAVKVAELQSDMRSTRRQLFWGLVVIAVVAWFV